MSELTAGTLDAYRRRIAELEAERDHWRRLYIRTDDEQAKVEAERDRLKAALDDIAGQRTIAEHREFTGGEDGDVEGAYDTIIEVARATRSGEGVKP